MRLLRRRMKDHMDGKKSARSYGVITLLDVIHPGPALLNVNVVFSLLDTQQAHRLFNSLLRCKKN